MTARTFKRYNAQVKRPAACFEGFTTVIDFLDGREVALFAPSKRLLVRACNALIPSVQMDPKRFQKTVYFQQERVTRTKRRASQPGREP